VYGFRVPVPGVPYGWGGGGGYQWGWPWPGTGGGDTSPGGAESWGDWVPCGGGCIRPAFWSAVDRLSTAPCVIRMYASSSEAWCGESSHSRTPASCARSLMRDSGTPVTRSAPSGSGRTCPPASVSADVSFSRCCGSVPGVRTRAKSAELAETKSFTLMSASNCPRPMTIR
jgi:hypothetical protein